MKAISKPVQVPGDAVNNANVEYKAHAQDLGWLPQVRDGQTAGTKGFGKRLEALMIDLSKVPGLRIGACVHIQNVGWVHLGEVRPDIILGSVGKSQRLEMVALYIIENTTGKKLMYQVHIAGLGDSSVREVTSVIPLTVAHGLGTTGQARAVEAFRMWLE